MLKTKIIKMNIRILPAILLFGLCACKSGNASNQEKSITQDTIKSFTLPVIPKTLTTPAQRADFLVQHYWDNVNFADTNYVHHPEITEQAWVDYCDILDQVPLEAAHQSVKNTIQKASTSKKMLLYITDLADKYLQDPNSPLRSGGSTIPLEEYYIPVLESMITSPLLDPAEKIRPKALLELALRNRINTQAADFTYTLSSGKQSKLYDLKADYVLLFFNNPGCHACTEIVNVLKNAAIIDKLITEKKLIILSVYPDEEIADWKKHLSEFPQTWINSYDKKFTIRDKQIYDLKAMPTLYLLDKNKSVILKDAVPGVVEEYLTVHG